jgi:hypothetical protein
VQIASLDFPANVGLLERPHYLPSERQIIPLKSGARVVEAADGGERHNELCEVIIARRDFGVKSALSDGQNVRKLGLRLIAVLNEKFVPEGLGAANCPAMSASPTRRREKIVSSTGEILWF